MRNFVILLSGLAMFLTGCITTPALWKRVDHFPTDISVLVSSNTQEVLVRYNEGFFTNSFTSSGGATGYQFRAYWLIASTNKTDHSLPELVDVTNSNDWVAVPFVTVVKKMPSPDRGHPGSTNQSPAAVPSHRFLSTTLVTNAFPDHGYYAVPRWRIFAGRSEFELWRDGEKLGTFPFPPDYSKWGKPTFARVTLTPIMATADTVIVIAFLYAGSGATFGSIP